MRLPAPDDAHLGGQCDQSSPVARPAYIELANQQSWDWRLHAHYGDFQCMNTTFVHPSWLQHRTFRSLG